LPHWTVSQKPVSATSLAVMEEFESVEALADMSLDKLMDFLVLRGKNRFDDPEALPVRYKRQPVLRTVCLSPWQTP
jgi:hypothetical protein